MRHTTCWNIGVKMERNWKVGRLNTKLLNFELTSVVCIEKIECGGPT